MAIAQIKLTFKQLIDASAQTDFERDIFDITYNEFLIKSRLYNAENECRTFTEMQKKDERTNALHYKLYCAVKDILNELKGKIPFLQDNLDKNISYETAELCLLESDLYDWAAHRFTINYTTGNLILHKIIGEYLLLSVPATQDSRTEEAVTFMLKLQPGLAITGYQEYQNKMASDFTGFAAN